MQSEDFELLETTKFESKSQENSSRPDVAFSFDKCSKELKQNLFNQKCNVQG
jgi:hypothetical protein